MVRDKVKALDPDWAVSIAAKMFERDGKTTERNVYDIVLNRIKNQEDRRNFVICAKELLESLMAVQTEAINALKTFKAIK